MAMSQDSGKRQQACVTPAALLVIAMHLMLARFPQLHDSLEGLVVAAAATGVDSCAAATGVGSCAGPPFLQGGHMLNLPGVVVQLEREAVGTASSKTVSFSPVGATTAKSCVVSWRTGKCKRRHTSRTQFVPCVPAAPATLCRGEPTTAALATRVSAKAGGALSALCSMRACRRDAGSASSQPLRHRPPVHKFLLGPPARAAPPQLAATAAPE